MPDFLPRREADLLGWSVNFVQLLESNPGAYGLQPQVVADYRALHDDFAAKYRRAVAPATRGPSAVLGKNIAKDAMIRLARSIAGQVRSRPEVSHYQLSALGLNVPKDPVRRVPSPDEAPHVSLLPVDGRKPLLGASGTGRVLRGLRMGTGSSVTVRLLDTAMPTSLARPRNASGATVFTYVGEEPPAEITGWRYHGQTTKTAFTIDFGPKTAPGAHVWVVARWFGTRCDDGPLSRPAGTRVAGGWAAAA